MSLMLEYIEKQKKGGSPGLEAELLNLIGKYNKERGRYLFIDSAAKPIWWKMHYQKGYQNTLAENKNRL